MAEQSSKTTGPQAQKSAEPERGRGTPGGRGGQSLARREGRENWLPSAFASPFELMRRMHEDMDRIFGRAFEDPFFQGWPSSRGLFGGSSAIREAAWSPRIEAFQRGNKFVVRAELPGLKRDDVDVEVSEDAITLRGERKQEQREEREGYYHSEHSYGSFFRRVPLPEGVITDNAQASFKDGILEITVDAPPEEVSRGRRLEIREA